MEKRYQVFVSSTYEDLKRERQEVIQSLLEVDCIPVGMEFFPAADEAAWEVIRRVIEECDYYVVIVAGRYGSLSAEGISYTQQEYEYAIRQGIPVMAFLHGDPGKIQAEKTEASDERRAKLQEFRDLCKEQKLCKHWKTPDDLASAVVKSLIQLRKTHPRIGWVRADQLSEESNPKEVLKLKKRIEELEAEREELRTTAPAGIDDLAQGEDIIAIRFSCDVDVVHVYSYGSETKRETISFEAERTWNAVLRALGPLMINEAAEYQLRLRMKDLLTKTDLQRFEKAHSAIRGSFILHVDDDAFHTIIIQLRSLGLIIQSVKPRSVKDTRNYWKLTPYGDTLLSKLCAIKRSDKGK